ALRSAARSSDAEVARRAVEVLDFLLTRCEKRDRDRLEALIKAGEIDRAIELFGRRPRWDEESAWQPLFELAKRLEVRTWKEFGAKPGSDVGPGLDAKTSSEVNRTCVRPSSFVRGPKHRMSRHQQHPGRRRGVRQGRQRLSSSPRDRRQQRDDVTV